MDSLLKIALAQLAPVWLDRQATTEKIVAAIDEAALGGAELVVFGEGVLPGYPFWLGLLDGAAWNTSSNKALHAHYARNAVDIAAGDLDSICDAARRNKIAVYLGIIERPADRGGHSLYCSLVYVAADGTVASVHRKLQPTYDERLTWSPGDGNGLRVHSLKRFTVGGLNCWENWMPLPRAALYAQGENLHVAVWPGSDHNTRDITRFIARESRSFVVSVSAPMRREDFPSSTPHFEDLHRLAPEVLANGGSCVAGPDGEWILEPVVSTEGLIYQEIDFDRVFEERQNFDPVGHYCRPDVTQLHVNRERQTSARFS